MRELHIDIRNKVATYNSRDGVIVCRNNNYKIRFTFDEEWNEHSAKQARFIWNNKYLDVVFTGDTVTVPIISQATMLTVGVYAGEKLRTTTPATIPCLLSILCVSGRAKEADYYEADGTLEHRLPAIRPEDNNKLLQAVNGKYELREAPDLTMNEETVSAALETKVKPVQESVDKLNQLPTLIIGDVTEEGIEEAAKLLNTDAKTIIAAINEINSRMELLPGYYNQEDGKWYERFENGQFLDEINIGSLALNKALIDISLFKFNVEIESGGALLSFSAETFKKLWDLMPDDFQTKVEKWANETVSDIRGWFRSEADEDDTFGEAAEKKIRAISEDVGSATKEGLTEMKNFFIGVGGATVDFATAAGTKIADISQKVADETVSGVQKGLTAVQDFVDGVGEATKDFIGDVGENANAAGQAVGEALAKAYSETKDWAEGFGQGIGNWYNGVKEDVGDGIESFGDAIGNVTKEAKEFISGVGEGLADWVEDVGDGAENFGKKVGNFFSGIAHKNEELENTINTLQNEIIGATWEFTPSIDLDIITRDVELDFVFAVDGVIYEQMQIYHNNNATAIYIDYIRQEDGVRVNAYNGSYWVYGRTIVAQTPSSEVIETLAKITGTIWKINDVIDPARKLNFRLNIIFISNDENFEQLKITTSTEGVYDEIITFVSYIRQEDGVEISVYDSENGWVNTAYQTLVVQNLNLLDKAVGENLRKIGVNTSEKFNTASMPMADAINKLQRKARRMETGETAVDTAKKLAGEENLKTIAKNVIGAINEVYTDVDNAVGTLQNIQEGYIKVGSAEKADGLSASAFGETSLTAYSGDKGKALADKVNDIYVWQQDVEEGIKSVGCALVAKELKGQENLETESKEIVGAINEVNEKVGTGGDAIGVDKVASIDTWYEGVSELDASDGIAWREGFAFYDGAGLEGNVLKTGGIFHRVPIKAGNNINFEVDGDVVKVNATGGGGVVGIDKVAAVDSDGILEESLYADEGGIRWNDTYIFRDENDEYLSTGIRFHHLPIVAGNGVEFELDEENQVIKVNAKGNYISKYVVELSGSEKVSDIIIKLTSTYPDYQFGVWSLIEFTGATSGLYGLTINHYGGNVYNIGGIDFGTFYTMANSVTDYSLVSLWSFTSMFLPPIPYCDSSNEGQVLKVVNGVPTWVTP